MYCCCAGRAVVQFKFLTRPAQVIQINLAARSVTGRAAQVELAGDKIASAAEQKCNRFLASRPLLTRLNWPKECSPLPAVGSGRTPGSQQSKQAGRTIGRTTEKHGASVICFIARSAKRPIDFRRALGTGWPRWKKIDCLPGGRKRLELGSARQNSALCCDGRRCWTRSRMAGRRSRRLGVRPTATSASPGAATGRRSAAT